MFKVNISYIVAVCCLLLCIFVSLFRKNEKSNYQINRFDVIHLLPIRGILAIMIVIVHVCYSYDNTNWIFELGGFGAPIVSAFFFFSGFGLIYSYIVKGASYLRGFLNKSLIKLFIPLFIASLIWISYKWFSGQCIVSDFIGIICYNPPLPYSWFVYALITLYIFYFAVFKLCKNLNSASKIIIIFVLTIGYGYLLRLLNYQIYWYLSLYGFNFGMLYGAYYSQINSIIKKYPVISILLYACVLIGCILIGLRTICLGIVPFTIVIVNGLIGSPTKSHTLNFLGTYSYEIYLAHGVIVPIVIQLTLPWLMKCLTSIIFSIVLAVILKYSTVKVNNLISKMREINTKSYIR